jgi:hypothetical protein
MSTARIFDIADYQDDFVSEPITTEVPVVSVRIGQHGTWEPIANKIAELAPYAVVVKDAAWSATKTGLSFAGRSWWEIAQCSPQGLERAYTRLSTSLP